jgi:hypothetical protein
MLWIVCGELDTGRQGRRESGCRDATEGPSASPRRFVVDHQSGSVTPGTVSLQILRLIVARSSDHLPAAALYIPGRRK